MHSDINVSRQGLLVLSTMFEGKQREWCGAELMKATGLPSGTIYPILLRFESQGLLSSHWENRSPSDLGRPRRRFYRLTGVGVHITQQLRAPFASNARGRSPVVT